MDKKAVTIEGVFCPLLSSFWEGAAFPFSGFFPGVSGETSGSFSTGLGG